MALAGNVPYQGKRHFLKTSERRKVVAFLQLRIQLPIRNENSRVYYLSARVSSTDGEQDAV